MRYNSFSDYLKNKYGDKVYKIPVNLELTCPNRDGNLGFGGCIFCGESGAAFEKLPSSMEIEKQIEENIRFYREKYDAKKYIIYFQNYTNTYVNQDFFENMFTKINHPDICAIYISTRPDCIDDKRLSILKEFSLKYKYDICIELGLQSVNYKTLNKLNRGHTLAEFIDAVSLIKKYEFQICAHMILNLPWDDEEDVIEGAKILSALKVDQVKLHSLYIVKGTPMCKQYENGEFEMGTVYDYVKRVVSFISYLSSDIVVQRLISRAKQGETVFSNYGLSWWKIKDNIENELELRDVCQGDKCDYLGAKVLKVFDK